MGGQACILYGAAEFTRDVDFAVAVGPETSLAFAPRLSTSRPSPSSFRRSKAIHLHLAEPHTGGQRSGA
jgi:hypothetical protein